jgi:hypothetical protein
MISRIIVPILTDAAGDSRSRRRRSRGRSSRPAKPDGDVANGGNAKRGTLYMWAG